MLPPNLLIVSIIIFLTTTISTAPVEEKEEVEVEATEEVEGELSEEEEDDDDSKSQDKIDEGPVGGQRTTTAAAVASGGSGASSNIQDQSAPSGQSAGGGTIDGIAGSAAVQTGDSSSADSSAGGPLSSAASQPTGPSGPSGPSGSSGSLSDVSAAQTQHTGVMVTLTLTKYLGSDGVDSESNSNGQKLLNGGGGADSQIGASDSLGDGVSHLDFTGTIDPSSHNFLLGLMGGGDPFGPGVHINIPGHMTPPTQLDSTVVNSGVTAAQHSGTSRDSPADPAYHINIDQLGVDLTSLSSEPDQSLSSSVSSSSYPAAQGADAADAPDVNGNGRQTLLTDTNTATDQFVSFTDLQTEVTGGADSVTSLHVDLTASGLGLTHDVTESTPVILHTASGGSAHTDLVTMAADSTGTDSGHPAVTDHTQMAGSVTEQYNPSGQGPEGAENVELEDTC